MFLRSNVFSGIEIDLQRCQDFLEDGMISAVDLDCLFRPENLLGHSEKYCYIA